MRVNEKINLSWGTTPRVVSRLRCVPEAAGMGFAGRPADHPERVSAIARQLAESLNFSRNPRARSAYAAFFSSKLIEDSVHTYKDLICTAALFIETGPEQIADQCLGKGLQKTEAEYAASLIQRMPFAAGITGCLEFESIISFLQKIDFDPGVPFLLYCNGLALRDMTNIVLLSIIVDFPFNLIVPFTVLADLSDLEKVESVGASHKKVFLVFTGRKNELEFHFTREHLGTLFRRKGLLEAQKSTLTVEEADESNQLERQISETQAELSLADSNPDFLGKRIQEAAQRVTVVSSMENAEASCDFSSFRNDLPVIIY